MRVELMPELSAPTAGVLSAAALLLAGHTVVVGLGLATLSLYVWLLARQE